MWPPMSLPDTNISSLTDSEIAYSSEAPGINVTSPEHRPMDGADAGRKVKVEGAAKASKQKVNRPRGNYFFAARTTWTSSIWGGCRRRQVCPATCCGT